MHRKGPSLLRPPVLLEGLLAAGRWPRTVEEQQRQNLAKLVPAERVRRLAPEESTIFLFAPPFRTVRDNASSNSYWMDSMAAPSEIDFDLALVIGDFGLGSDAPILLDYREAPCVIRLRWSLDGGENHWVMMAPDFETFVRELGL
jgi:hypothetical protein